MSERRTPFGDSLARRAGARVGVLPLFLLFLIVSEGPAAAGCSDKPGPGVDWTKCQKMRLVLKGQDLSKSHMERVNLGSTDLMDANLAGAMMVYADLERARLKQANLEAADLTKVQGGRADFEEANLAGAVLTKAELARTNFTDAILTKADMTKAEFGRAVFSGADLAGADLSYANISRALFDGAVLSGVDLTGAYTLLAHFEGTDLSETVGLEQEQLEIACGDAETKLPDGLTLPGSWPCGE
jgi:uncharacterized protein YjbI with pentapeptide repeats